MNPRILEPLVSYILPVYQAESFIYNNLSLFSKYCAESNLPSEIIAVNDGSSDRTNEEIERFLKDNETFISQRDTKNNENYPSPIPLPQGEGVGGRVKKVFSGENKILVKYINLPKNVGKGFAIKKGFEASEGQYIVFTDCDLPYSFKNIRDVVDSLINNGANVVIACRMHKDSIYKIRSENLSYIYIRHTSGRVYNYLINFLTGLNIEDTQAGLKGFDRATADLIFRKMTISGFAFDVDILTCARANKKKISTIPIEFNYNSEMTTINFVRQTFVMTFGLLRVFLKRVTGYYKK